MLTIHKRLQIEKFISSKFPKEEKVSQKDYWNNGRCYYFALILCSLFSELEIYYDPVNGHFIAGDGKHFYDVCGEYNAEKAIPLKDIKDNDKEWYERLRRDCIGV